MSLQVGRRACGAGPAVPSWLQRHAPLATLLPACRVAPASQGTDFWRPCTAAVPPLVPPLYCLPADKREKQYERDNTGTMYLFRMDASQVIDATHRVGAHAGQRRC